MNELLGNYNLAQIVSFLLVIFSVFLGFVKFYETISKYFIQLYNKKHQSDESSDILKNHSQDIEDMKKYQTVLGTGIKEILKTQLKAEFRRITKRGDYIYITELEDYLEAYTIYHNLGGNGSITRRKEVLECLEVKDDDDKMAD